MKILILLTIFFNVSFAHEVLNCTVPSESSKKVTVTLKYNTDEDSDYLLLQINDIISSIFLTQSEKGKILKSFNQKNFSYLLLSERSQNNNGVVTNAAYLSIENREGTVAGFVSAKGSIYPLVCSQ